MLNEAPEKPNKTRRGRKVELPVNHAAIPTKFRAPLMSKVVDKGTVYQRTVYLDPNTIGGQEEMLQGTIATFLQGRRGRVKSAERRAKDAEAKNRRYGRRREHEGWMKQSANQPTTHFSHPFYANDGTGLKKAA